MSFSGLSKLPLLLASQSPTRYKLLKDAGLSVISCPALVDETEIQKSLKAQNAKPSHASETIADAKGMKISRSNTDILVIAADQLLTCGSMWFEKPRNFEQAYAQLTALSGKTHHLWTSVSLWYEGNRIWHHTDQSDMTMYDLTKDDIDFYLEHAGDNIFACVGSYQVEGLGLRLFRHIKGDIFSIQGLPLLPLLSALRFQVKS